MGIINYIEFGGVKSSDYGIYVSGEGTFNAPERDVELIEIPGRNGDLSLDKGRFKNITVTYPVFNYETNLTDFRTRLSDFRNALKSKIGYQRLEDTFHPDEYRMATFIDVFEVQPVMYNTASTIELTFNCKPQRFLKSGETAQVVASGGVFTNPTPFEAHPLIEAHGYGSINMNGRNITLAQGQPVGDVVLWNGAISSSNSLVEIPLKPALFGSGDTFYLSATMGFIANLPNESFTNSTQGSATSSSADVIVNNGSFVFGSSSMAFDVLANDIEFVAGTAKQVDVTFTINTTSPTRLFYAYLHINYEPDENQIRILSTAGSTNKLSVEGSAEGFSTYIPDTATYIDCEMGEAYYIENGAIVSANNSVSLPAILPELKAGLNDITYDDTITELKITPRYWKI